MEKFSEFKADITRTQRIICLKDIDLQKIGDILHSKGVRSAAWAAARELCLTPFDIRFSYSENGSVVAWLHRTRVYHDMTPKPVYGHDRSGNKTKALSRLVGNLLMKPPSYQIAVKQAPNPVLSLSGRPVGAPFLQLVS